MISLNMISFKNLEKFVKNFGNPVLANYFVICKTYFIRNQIISKLCIVLVIHFKLTKFV